MYQTCHDSDHAPLNDPLIIAHAPIPSWAIHSFATHGVPPHGFVFIEWAREEYGHSLVSQEDVVLVDRPFNIGDTVKTSAAASMIGTVVNVSETYSLEPIACITGGALDFGRRNHPIEEACASSSASQARNMASDVLNDVPQLERRGLLYNIPGEELKRVADFVERDYVLRKDWIGVVEDVDPEVVLLLDNNTLVVPKDPEELELVIPDFGKPLITLPDLDGIRRPDIVAANAGGIMSTACIYLRRGQFVITNTKNIREGRWLSGTYQENCKPQGYIVDSRTLRLEVRSFPPWYHGRLLRSSENRLDPEPVMPMILETCLISKNYANFTPCLGAVAMSKCLCAGKSRRGPRPLSKCQTVRKFGHIQLSFRIASQ